MAIGAKDHIDKMLVKKYAKECMNNMEHTMNMEISRDRYWEIMTEVAQIQKTFVKISNTFQNNVAKDSQNNAMGTT